MNKKLSIFFMSAVCAGATLTSCTDLDSDKWFDDRITEEQIFSEKTSSEEWLAHAYSWLLDCNVEVSSKGGTGGSSVTVDGVTYNVEGARWNPFNFDDDIYYGDRDNKAGGDNKDADFASYNAFHEGNYHEDCGYSAWVRCYKGINQATTFINKIYMNKELSASEIEDYRGQARFVRAYFYWLLLKKYGPVPIVDTNGVDYTLSYDELSIPRATYEEMADFIGEEMVQAAKEIKTTHRDANNICRPTVGTCLATRALAYLYAASPLANGQLKNGQHPAGVDEKIAELFVNRDGTPLLSREYKEEKWAKAAAACKDVMELGCYELYHAALIPEGSGQDGYPVTVKPYDDGNFSTKNWPNGYADIDPLQSYRQLFDGDVYPADNPELIFTRGVNFGFTDNDLGIGALVLHEMPTELGGWNTHGVTQKMVDTYYMNDGTDVDGMYSEWRDEYPSAIADGNSRPRKTNVFNRDDIKAGEAPANYPELSNAADAKGSTKPLTNAQFMNVSQMHMKREPRFYASVAYSGTIWENGVTNNPVTANKFRQVSYFRNGGNGWVNNFQYPRTGTAMKKFYGPKDYCPNNQNTYSGIQQKYEPAIRYADILLMYAEALNELDGSYQIQSWNGTTTYTIARDVNEIKKGTNPVRIRAGLPDYSDEIYGNKNLLRKTIKRERMIEFMGEAKRYFDLRRWMDAPIEEATPVYGLNVFMTAANKDEFFQVIPTYNLKATFNTKLYFWPISHTELKRNKNLVQSPGWTEND